MVNTVLQEGASLSQFSSSCSDMWSLFHGAISESRSIRPSPHAEGLAAQVVPALAHAVQTSPEQSAVLRVAERGNPNQFIINPIVAL
ncbi:hypothetical protein EYF80_043433 [Liparis tanakae]|uniref:Uncharacterized protein n=1 Tax=Liparis tanakae TaxID=230148 RepID=A0A4Z2G0F7_9TELE|nr:hypothetical protein EYF80_043433 [Liparis tanakae]